MREYLLVLLVAAAVTFLASGVCRRIALRTGALAQVRDRDVHTIEMPYFGGVAMFVGVLAAIAARLAAALPRSPGRWCSRTRWRCWSRRR